MTAESEFSLVSSLRCHRTPPRRSRLSCSTSLAPKIYEIGGTKRGPDPAALQFLHRKIYEIGCTKRGPDPAALQFLHRKHMPFDHSLLWVRVGLVPGTYAHHRNTMRLQTVQDATEDGRLSLPITQVGPVSSTLHSCDTLYPACTRRLSVSLVRSGRFRRLNSPSASRTSRWGPVVTDPSSSSWVGAL